MVDRTPERILGSDDPYWLAVRSAGLDDLKAALDAFHIALTERAAEFDAAEDFTVPTVH